MGKKSTRNVPGSRARSIAAIASSDAEKNLSLSDSMFTPYAIDRIRDPVRLPSRKRRSESETVRGLSEDDIQMCMLQEALGGIREPTEEDSHCHMNIIVEPTCSWNVEETVE